MGGTLQVTSTFGQGSTFWFDLVLPEGPSRQAPGGVQERKITGIRGPSRRVLIVDDKLDNRMFLYDLLTPLGFEVSEAIDGEDCLRQLELTTPDVILMDLRMPKMDGLEATRQIRTNHDLKHVIIIAISASSFEHNRKECAEVGTNGFLSKPFRINKLLELLSEHLEIELIYEGIQVEPKGTTPIAGDSQSMSGPSSETLDHFIDLAMRGDIKNLLEEVNRLEKSDSQFTAFATQLKTLAQDYQVKKLCQFLQGMRARQ